MQKRKPSTKQPKGKATSRPGKPRTRPSRSRTPRRVASPVVPGITGPVETIEDPVEVPDPKVEP